MTRGQFIVRPAHSTSKLPSRFKLGRVLRSDNAAHRLDIEWFHPAGWENGLQQYFSEFTDSTHIKAVEDFLTFQIFEKAEEAVTEHGE